MNSHRVPVSLVLFFAAVSCKSSSAPAPNVPIPELPIAPRAEARTTQATPSMSLRAAIAALPRPDLVLPSMVAGARAASQPVITIGGAASTLQSAPTTTLDGGRQDLVLKLVLRDAERSKDSHGRTMTVNLRAGHLVSETSSQGRLAGSPPVRREGNLSPDDYAKIVAVIEARRLNETESHLTDTTKFGRYIDATLDIEWRGKKSSIRLAGMTRLLGSEAKTEFAEHPLSKRVAVLLTTLRRIIAGY
jgi:hypothetical protein